MPTLSPNVLVLGGAGAVGRVAVRTLAAHDAFSCVVAADVKPLAIEDLNVGPGRERVTTARVDVSDGAALAAALRDAAVVVNCTGPFYRFGPPVLRAAIEAGVAYVDVCDDVDATLAALDLDEAARARGVRAVIGMGNSPGVTNLLARFAADQLLDTVDAVDIYHAHGGEAFEGAGVVAHRLHGMQMAIPVYLDGALRTVGFFEPDGLALREDVEFHLLGPGIRVYPYPHPEQLTLPRHIPLRRVTNRGTVLPAAYFERTVEVARLGLADTTPLAVGAATVAPRDFAIAWLLRERERLLAETAFGPQRGCAKVVVRGTRHGAPRTYVFSMASRDQALGEGTGIPVAMGAILLAQGKVRGPGVLPPEAAIEPLDFLALVAPVLAGSRQQGSFEGVLVERVLADGTVERVDLPL